MLSIRFGSYNEWWVPGAVFDQLFQAALDNGTLPTALEYWRDVGNANGGFDLSDATPTEANQIILAFRDTAQSELRRLGNEASDSDGGTYRLSLLKLLSLPLLL
jgi:hypothetical protein